MAEPVYYQGKVELIVAAQLSLDQINAIMQERTGLGETGVFELRWPVHALAQQAHRALTPRSRKRLTYALVDEPAPAEPLWTAP